MKSAKRMYTELVIEGRFTVTEARETRHSQTGEVEEYLLVLEVPPHARVGKVFLRIGRSEAGEYNQLAVRYRSGRPENYDIPLVYTFAKAQAESERLKK